MSEVTAVRHAAAAARRERQRPTPGKLLTFLWLMWLFALQAVAWFLRRAESEGVEEFTRNYIGDNILPLPDGERRAIYAGSRCIACGLCDAVGVRPAGAERIGPDGPAFMATFLSRSMTEMWTARDFLDKAVSPERLAVAAQVCPTGVPLTEQLAFIRRTRTAVERKRVEILGDGRERMN